MTTANAALPRNRFFAWLQVGGSMTGAAFMGGALLGAPGVWVGGIVGIFAAYMAARPEGTIRGSSGPAPMPTAGPAAAAGA